MCAEVRRGWFCFRCRQKGDRQSWEQEAHTESRVERDKRKTEQGGGHTDTGGEGRRRRRRCVTLLAVGWVWAFPPALSVWPSSPAFCPGRSTCTTTPFRRSKRAPFRGSATWSKMLAAPWPGCRRDAGRRRCVLDAFPLSLCVYVMMCLCVCVHRCVRGCVLR